MDKSRYAAVSLPDGATCPHCHRIIGTINKGTRLARHKTSRERTATRCEGSFMGVKRLREQRFIDAKITEALERSKEASK